MGDYVNRLYLVDANEWDGSEKKFHQIRTAGKDVRASVRLYGKTLIVETIDGTQVVPKGDIVVKTMSGGLSVVEKKNFEKNYLKIT
jgi:hypothetical protein